MTMPLWSMEAPDRRRAGAPSEARWRSAMTPCVLAVLFAAFIAFCSVALAWVDGRRVAMRDAELDRLEAERDADADEAASTYNALTARIAGLEAEALKWYQSAADGIDGALEHGVRESDQRDARIAEMTAERDALTVARNADRTEWMTTYETMRAEIEVLRCSDLDAFYAGELAPPRADAFRLHLATCPACQSGLRGLMVLGAIASTAPRAG